MTARDWLLTLFQHQTLYWLRSDVRFLTKGALQRLTGAHPGNVKRESLFLNAGCGANGRADARWFNVDGCSRPNVDFVCDLRRPLPFPCERFRGIFCEHFFEHLTPPQAVQFLSECRRILAPGGVLRLSVPDGELYLRNYFENRDWMLERRNRRFNTPMAVVNEVFRQGYEHQYCYDYETLACLLTDAGFMDVQRARFGEGRLAELLIDQDARRFESLYIEAARRS